MPSTLWLYTAEVYKPVKRCSPITLPFASNFLIPI
ncbi:Uncharacterised protein [Vibrio cholerae]|nr:Uncharacterised protein [Vibrio cholerae]CSC30044.1 Uncharacterised protein [Vibrio cholerae]